MALCSSAIYGAPSSSRYHYNFPGMPPAPSFLSRFWLWQHKEADHRSVMPSAEQESRANAASAAIAASSPGRNSRQIEALIAARVILSILASAPCPEHAKSSLALHVRCLSREIAWRVLERIDNPDLAVVFFDWAESLPSYHHSVYACNGMLQIFVDSKRHRHGYEFYRHRLLGSYAVNEVSYGILMQGFCKAGEFQQALELLDEMKSNGVRPNVVIHTTIIRGLCTAGKVSQALLHFRRIGEDCAPNVYTYSILVDALCKSGQPHEAYGLVTEMVKKGCSPNVVTYNALIDGFRKLERLDEVLMLLKEMSQRGCRADVITYTMILDIFCKNNSIDEAYRLLNALEKRNVVTYNSLFTALSTAEGDRTTEALSLLEKMIQEGTRPNQVNYRTVLLMLCKNSRLDEAYQVLLSMYSQGCKTDDVSYKILVVAFASAGRTYDSLELLGRMLGSGYILDTKTMNVVIHKFCKAGDLHEAHQLFKSMCQRGSIPSNVTYNTLIGAFCKAQQPDTAVKLLHQMIQADFKPNVITYNSIIKSFCREQREEEARGIFQMMVDSGCFPDRVSYTTLKISKNDAAIYDQKVHDTCLRKHVDPQGDK
ncbi:pentatricopeptide repeat-containing protein At1g09900-like [Selaginella moellendorffii]|nr:pentatricopeptide repeat-containing protein At1g09900-like [Selaginella moellendorffii]|eukprot:XP_024535044.1 pentatricopeptide repeat-containing protein At1g09900-like [Selaginella moellendorffii]